MTYRNNIWAICLLILLMEMAPVYGNTGGLAIIAVRTSAVWNLGHVGVGFQNDDGTWTVGAIENSGGSPIVLAQKGLMGTEVGASTTPSRFNDNDAWVESNINLKSVEAKFRSRGYDGLKVIQVSDPNPDNAKIVINDLSKRGYNVVTYNCLSATIDVLSAYGAKNLPLQIAHVAPNNYYSNVKGEEYLWDASKNAYTNLINGIFLADNPSMYITHSTDHSNKNRRDTSNLPTDSQTSSNGQATQVWWNSIYTWVSTWIGMVQNELPLTSERLLYTFGTVVVLFLGISLIWRSLRDFIINGVSGLAILYLSSTYLGIDISLNTFTLLVCAIGGVPGAVLLLALKQFYGIIF